MKNLLVSNAKNILECLSQNIILEQNFDTILFTYLKNLNLEDKFQDFYNSISMYESNTKYPDPTTLKKSVINYVEEILDKVIY